VFENRRLREESQHCRKNSTDFLQIHIFQSVCSYWKLNSCLTKSYHCRSHSLPSNQFYHSVTLNLENKKESSISGSPFYQPARHSYRNVVNVLVFHSRRERELISTFFLEAQKRSCRSFGITVFSSMKQLP